MPAAGRTTQRAVLPEATESRRRKRGSGGEILGSITVKELRLGYHNMGI